MGVKGSNPFLSVVIKNITMNKLNSITLSKFSLKLTYLLDLIYFKDSLVSVFLNEQQEFYLYYWLSVNSICKMVSI